MTISIKSSKFHSISIYCFPLNVKNTVIWPFFKSDFRVFLNQILKTKQSNPNPIKPIPNPNLLNPINTKRKRKTTGEKKKTPALILRKSPIPKSLNSQTKLLQIPSITSRERSRAWVDRVREYHELGSEEPKELHERTKPEWERLRTTSLVRKLRRRVKPE